jgi:LysR family glycine cleavage system transcriptional activator
MAINFAVDGNGVCLESLYLVERELKTGGLVAPLGLEGLTAQSYVLNFYKDRATLPKIEYFRDWLFEELKGFSPV